MVTKFPIRLPSRIYVGRTLNRQGQVVRHYGGRETELFATRESVIETSLRYRQLGFRLTLRLQTLHW